jgi:redox-sensitive bicupin YhaK (pirin superfamily)
VSIHQRDAVLSVGRLDSKGAVEVPDAPHVHLFVAVGTAALDDTALETGDAARLTDAGVRSLTAGPGGAEVLVWATA